jgi:hypothetical protein
MQEVSHFKCPYIDKSEIWRSAEEFREKYWRNNILPVDIESIVENKLKLNILPEHGLLSECDIDAYLRVDLTGIVVDYDRFMDERFINRLRFSYAHELGHLILHKDVYTQFPISNPSDWKDFMLNIPDREYGFFEYQANEFAGRVLVPRIQLINELNKCIKIITENGMTGYLASDPTAMLEAISNTLCKPFGVSSQAIEKRVEREKLWPPKIEYINRVPGKILEFGSSHEP